MSDDTKKQLQSQLWNIANTLRGKMGADEFRDYILGFIFYKYLSERMHLFADEILQHDGVKFDEIDEATDDGNEMLAAIQEESVGRLGYFLKPSELFHKLAEKGAQKADNFILEDLTAVLKHIEASTMGHDSEEDFEGLFEDLDLGSSKLGKTENQKNELIAKVLVHLDQIDFRLADTEADVLGDAYEYLIGQFASGAGKKAGEFYTPQEVSTILAKIVTTGKQTLKSIYDPTCGSGSLLLRVAKEVDDVGHFYGQEMNPTTYNLARMNMILHGVHYQRFDLKNEDTLEHPHRNTPTCGLRPSWPIRRFLPNGRPVRFMKTTTASVRMGNWHRRPRPTLRLCSTWSTIWTVEPPWPACCRTAFCFEEPPKDTSVVI